MSRNEDFMAVNWWPILRNIDPEKASVNILEMYRTQFDQARIVVDALLEHARQIEYDKRAAERDQEAENGQTVDAHRKLLAALVETAKFGCTGLGVDGSLCPEEYDDGSLCPEEHVDEPHYWCSACTAQAALDVIGAGGR